MLRRTLASRGAAALVLFAALAAPSLARAQQPSEADLALGREAYGRGVAAAEAGEWLTARVEFERAYELARSPAILFNLGGAQRRTGLLVEALQSYRVFLREVQDGPAAAQRPIAERELANLEPLVPRITIDVNNGLDGDEVLLDGTPVDTAQFGEVRVNPGNHEVVLRRNGEQVASTRFDIAGGESRDVSLDAPAAVPRPDEIPDPDPDNGHTQVDDDDGGGRVGLWVGIGVGAAALIAVVVIVAVVVGGGGAPNPFQGNFGPGHLEIP